MPDRLSELRPSILDMDPEVLREHVRRIRADRRLTKERPSVKKTVARSKDKDKTVLDKLLSSLSPEELEALLGETGDADAGQGNTTEGNQGKE